jgi:hypothetical protein
MKRDVGSVHIERLIPVRIQRLLDNARRMGLLSIDRDDRKWIRQSEHVSLGEAICGYDCVPYLVRTADKAPEPPVEMTNL